MLLLAMMKAALCSRYVLKMEMLFAFRLRIIILKLFFQLQAGREEPAVSMDTSGKIIWAKHSEVQQANLKALSDGAEVKDGEKLPLAVKDMGSCEIYPHTVAHNPNGR